MADREPERMTREELIRAVARKYGQSEEELRREARMFGYTDDELFAMLHSDWRWKLAGVLVAVAAVAAMAYWGLYIEKPRAVALMAAGRWTLWDELLDKLTVAGFGALAGLGVALMNGPALRRSPRRVLGAVLWPVLLGAVLGLIFGLGGCLRLPW